MENNLLSKGMLPLKQLTDDISVDTQDILSLFLPQRVALHKKKLKLQSFR